MPNLEGGVVYETHTSLMPSASACEGELGCGSHSSDHSSAPSRSQDDDDALSPEPVARE